MSNEDRKKTLWCGNLSDQVNEELLFELFTQAGPLEAVVIPKTRDGMKRSFGFIRFKHEESVSYAKALMDGISLCGRNLRLECRSNSPENDVYSNSQPVLQRTFTYPDKVFQGNGFAINGTRNDIVNNRAGFGDNEDVKRNNGRRSNWNGKSGHDKQVDIWNKNPWEGHSGPAPFLQNHYPDNKYFQQDDIPENCGFINGNVGTQQYQQPFMSLPYHSRSFPNGRPNHVPYWTSFR